MIEYQISKFDKEEYGDAMPKCLFGGIERWAFTTNSALFFYDKVLLSWRESMNYRFSCTFCFSINVNPIHQTICIYSSLFSFFFVIIYIFAIKFLINIFCRKDKSWNLKENHKVSANLKKQSIDGRIFLSFWLFNYGDKCMCKI